MTAPHVAVDPETMESAHSELLSDTSIQFDLPEPEKFEPSAFQKFMASILEWIGAQSTIIFWAAVAVVVLLVLNHIVRNATGYSWKWPWQRRAETEPVDDWTPDRKQARTLLSEADALADQGDYDGAVHLLMIRSVEEIARRRPDFLRPSLTARDIAIDTRLPDAPRTAFGRIARVVERALFARTPVGQPGWSEARDAYEQFAFREGWKASTA